MPLPPIDPPHRDAGPARRRRRPAPEAMPRTTREKAALYLVIAPHVAGLADELWTLASRAPGRAAAPPLAAPEIVAQAAALLADARRLVRCEPDAHLAALRFAPPMPLHALALGMRQLARAVDGFRARYHGHDPLSRQTGWAVAAADGRPGPRWIGPPVPAGLDGEIGELNQLTASLLRHQFLELAAHTRTPLPPTLLPPAPAEPPAAAIVEAAPPTPSFSRETQRRARRFVRQAARRATRPAAPAAAPAPSGPSIRPT